MIIFQSTLSTVFSYFLSFLLQKQKHIRQGIPNPFMYQMPCQIIKIHQRTQQTKICTFREIKILLFKKFMVLLLLCCIHFLSHLIQIYNALNRCITFYHIDAQEDGYQLLLWTKKSPKTTPKHTNPKSHSKNLVRIYSE